MCAAVDLEGGSYMEISFANKGIYHYLDARVGTMPELEAQGRLYQLQMLTENQISYILPSSVLCSDGEVWISHNTGQCYNLQAMLQSKRMDGSLFRRLMEQICACVEQTEGYLLDPADLVLRAEYIFYDTEKEMVQVMCVPGYDHPVREQLREFLEILMPRFDHSDQTGERFLYECHAILTDEWKDFPALASYIGNIGKQYTEPGCSCERTHADGTDVKEEIAWQQRSGTDCAPTGGNRYHRRQAEPEMDMAEDTIFSKRFFLYVLAGGAALALIIKYLFFDGTTGTAIFGIVWLLTLIVLAIMTVQDKEDGQESEVAMREYSGQAAVQEYNGQASMQGYRMVDEMPVQEYSGQKKPAMHSVDEPQKLPGEPVRDSRAAAMKLVPLTNGALEPFRIPEGTATLTIGRDKSSDYRVTTTQISRVHARLFHRPDGLYIEDADSTNGTFINTKRIPAMTEQRLEKGDVVGFANEEFFVS